MNLWKNSKYVKKGDYYLVDEKNECYVKDAIKNGATKTITELDNTYDVETIKVDNVNDYLINSYDFSNIKLIGITGTNGKTTTCFLIYQMLKILNIKVSYIGTIGFYIDEKVMDLDNTTPEIDLLYNLINTSKESGCEVVVMEVSSHSLKQNRVYGLLFDSVAVTNITQDHIDYHKTLNDYINSKRKIIDMTKNNKICILNKKDKYYKSFINKNNKNIILNKDIKIKKIKNSIEGISFILKDDKKYKIKLSLNGVFNIYNFLYAYLIIKKLGYNHEYILLNAHKLKEPVGRMDKVIYNKNVIFIDYAHTPDAVSKVLKTVNKIKNKKVITIIGCGGNRDKEKRKVMGKYATKHSNHVIFTNDNPRYEDERIIMKDIIKGAKKNYEVIYNRKDAIRKGISLLRDNMILMILGKGHETYQIIKDKKEYFSDKEIALDIINSM